MTKCDFIYGFDPIEAGLRRGNWQSGDNIHVCCPYHGGSGKSAGFNIKTGAFHCFKCGANSNVYKIASEQGGRVVKTQIKKAYRANTVENWRHYLAHPVDTKNQYLLDRQVTPAQIEFFEIRTTPDSIVIPTKNQWGETIGVVIRKQEGKIRYLYGGERAPLWPLEFWHRYNRHDKPIVVVEGIFGALRGMLFGYQTFATLGAIVTKNTLKHLRVLPRLRCVFDPDDAGYVAGYRILKNVGIDSDVDVVVPGFEVDECDGGMWKHIVERASTTKSIERLAGYVKNEKMRRYLK
jgi:DNA primase